jgi:hypothetical protein
MKKLLIIFLMLWSGKVFATAGPVSPANFVSASQSDAITPVGTFSSGNLPHDISNATGHYLFVLTGNCTDFACSGPQFNGPMDTATDTLGHTFTKCGTNTSGSVTLALTQFYAKITTSGTDAVTVHSKFGGTSNTYQNFIEVFEFQGIAPDAVCRAGNSITQPGSTTSPSISTAYPVPCGQFVWTYFYTATPSAINATVMGAGRASYYRITSGVGIDTTSATTSSGNPNIVLGSLASDDACNVGVTYYVDYTGGSDSNTGLSKVAAFKHWPYSSSCSSLCGAVSLHQSDHVIRRGGETWTTATSGTTNLSGISGTSGKPITFGVDQTWYTGGSFTKPKYDAAYAAATLFTFSNSAYIDIDNTEMAHVSAPSNYGTGMASFNDSHHINFTNIYAHGWRFPSIGGGSDGAHGGFIATHYANIATDSPTITFTDCVVENSENTGSGTQTGAAFNLVGPLLRVTIHDVHDAILFATDFNYGEMYNIAYPSGNVSPDFANFHGNGAYLDPTAEGQTVGWIRNSKFHDASANGMMAYPNIRDGATMYVYNNIFYGIISSQGPIHVDPYQYCTGPSHVLPCEGPGNVYISNNVAYIYATEEDTNEMIRIGDRSGASTGPQLVNNLTANNNQTIGPSGTVTLSRPDLISGTYTHLTNIIQTSAQASAQSYLQANLWAPQNGSGDTVSAGTNGSGVFTNAIDGSTRPSTWDIGPWQWTSVSPGSSPRSKRFRGR